MITLIQFLLVLAFAIALIEVAARLWLRHFSRAYPWRPFTHFEMQPDPKILPQLSTHTTFRANSLGLRGREPPDAQNVFRIVTCGGSAVECFSLDDAEAWPQIIEQTLSRPENKARLGVDDVHVLNCAKSGFTNESLGYLLPRVLDRAGPIDVLTITTSAASVTTWAKAGAPAYPYPAGHVWDDVHWHAEGVWGWTLASSAVAEISRRAVHWLKRPVTTLRNTGAAMDAGRRAYRNAKELRDTYPDPAGWIASYEASLGELIQSARRYARRVVLLRQSWYDAQNPSSAELAQFWQGFVGDAAPEKREIFYSHKVFCQLMVLADEANVRVARRYGADCVRLADAVTPSIDTYYDQIHYAPKGARLAGEFVARELLALATSEQIARAVTATAQPATAIAALPSARNSAA